LKHRPELELPRDTRITESRGAPQAGVVIHNDPSPWRKTHHRLEAFFSYGALRLGDNHQQASVFDSNTLTVHHRDIAFERAAREQLAALGAKEEWHYGAHGKCLAISSNKLGRLISELVDAGWRAFKRQPKAFEQLAAMDGAGRQHQRRSDGVAHAALHGARALKNKGLSSDRL